MKDEGHMLSGLNRRNESKRLNVTDHCLDKRSQSDIQMKSLSLFERH
jgi:hypothetical protein